MLIIFSLLLLYLSTQSDVLAIKARNHNNLIQHIKEGETFRDEYWHRIQTRINTQENKMSYEDAKRVHQDYLDSMDRLQVRWRWCGEGGLGRGKGKEREEFYFFHELFSEL
jgi:hypothetical protein